VDTYKKMKKTTIAMAVLGLFLASGTASTLPPGFTETTFASGIASGTAMAFAPDGRLFVCQQTGALRVIRDGALLPTPFVTLNVDSNGERGLLGVAFDPNFAVNPYVYVYYTVSTSPVHNRLSRFRANGDVAGSEEVLLELDTLSSSVHNGGALHFSADGKLFISVGDNRTGPNAQDLTSLKGKILRLNPNGTIPPDNPFVQSPTARHEIWAYGLRNPFTFAFKPGTNFLFINDVGEATWEEVNLGIAGANYGWPLSEGPTNDPDFVSPVYWYGHDVGCAIVGATFYSPIVPTFPVFYRGKYFFGDYCSGFIRVLDPTTYGETDFATLTNPPVDIQTGNDGSLYYLSRRNSSVMRIAYSLNQVPVITTQPASQLISVNHPVTFSVLASGPTPYTYQWQRNGVNISGATSQTYRISSVALSDDGARFRVRVSNNFGSVLSNEAVLSVTTNKPPTAQILTPIGGTTYFAGQRINYSGTALDPEDGDLPGSAFTWQVDFHHNTHIHPFIPPTTGSKIGSFVTSNNNEVSANVYYILTLRVRDSVGLTSVKTRNILPQKVTMTFATQPGGLKIGLDDTAASVAPFQVTGVVGILRQITAPTPQIKNGITYIFSSWSDGGARTHQITTPSANTTYTATFTQQ
jgi:glucose/arabinose dehydrogenase